MTAGSEITTSAVTPPARALRARLDAAAPMLHRIAVVLVVALPLALLYARAFADIAMVLTTLLFLASPAGRIPHAWLGRPWFAITALWWVWLVICSTGGAAGWHGFLQALVAIRLPLFAAALGAWVLVGPGARRALLISISLAALWIAIECWQQYLTGTNIIGLPAFGDGALTGPFDKPRAGPALILIFFPAVLPWSLALANPPAGGTLPPLLGKALGGLLLFWAVATVVLIGQRMPSLLLVLGLLLTAMLVPKLRLVALAALAVGVVILALTPIISPPTFQKLVLKFWDQVSHFAASPYGQLFLRAVGMTELHPWFGLGHDAFRTVCGDHAYMRGLPWLGIPPEAATSPEGCNLHPHNFYLQAATASGVPGLIVFTGAIATWVATVGRGPWRQGDVLGTALFVQLGVAVFPIASTNDFLALPNAGWLFLVLGFALSQARASTPMPRSSLSGKV